MRSFEIRLPDDLHLHVRDGDTMKDVVGHTAAQFGRAIIMPNLKPPVVTVADAEAYAARIRSGFGDAASFEPLMTLYMTDRTTPALIEAAVSSDSVHAFKLYPAGATTNSDSGVTDITAMDDVFATMAREGMPLLIHGEVTHSNVDIFERETRFLAEVLAPLMKRHPQLRIVLEHITTAAAVDFVAEGPGNIAATITAHHLVSNRNDMLAGGIRPHYYCLPILKRETDRIALLKAATSNSGRFFLGTDSAPHAINDKETVCGCAGCYTASDAMNLYASAFDSVDALNRLEDFSSVYGAQFYALPLNDGRLRFDEQAYTPPDVYAFGNNHVRPFAAGQTLNWSVRRIG